MQIARAAARHQTPGRMARNRPAMPIELILDSMNRPPGKVMVKAYLLEWSCLPQTGNGDREVLGSRQHYLPTTHHLRRRMLRKLCNQNRCGCQEQLLHPRYRQSRLCCSARCPRAFHNLQATIVICGLVFLSPDYV